MRTNKRLYVIIAVALLLLLVGVTSAAPNAQPLPPPIPIKLPDEVVALPPGQQPDSIRDLSPRMPGHAPGGRPGGGGCDKDIDLTSSIRGVSSVAAVDTGICTNADIDTYTRDTKTYVVLAGGDDAAWTHIDVTNPANPKVLAQYVWARGAKGTYSPDIKTFRRGTKDYISLSTELGGGLQGTCGHYIFDVTNPTKAVHVSRILESGVWCSTHNSFVEDDANGEGRYVYIGANSSADLRAYDILDPANPVKLGTYQRQTRGFFSSSVYDDIYVHDVTVEKGAVYVSYWSAGLDMFPASLVKVTGAIINETHSNVTNIDPPNFPTGKPFLVHHAYPSLDGSLVGIEDEIEIASGSAVVQLWTTSGGYVDGLVQGNDVPVLPAHNLEVSPLTGNRLYVGWYKAGMQGWDFSSSGFSRLNTPLRTAVQYHQVQTEAADDAYDGAWGVRLAEIGGKHYVFHSDRRYGLIVDRID